MLRFPTVGARAFIPAALAAALIFPAATPEAVEANTSTRAADVIRVAKAQLGKPWVYGATGPGSFDCSGLVIYAFKQTGNLGVIGNGKFRSARAMYDYFRSKGKTSSSGRPGDLVVWGGGTHIGIYLGDGKAISTLTSGVKVHGVHAVTAKFTAYLKTGLSGSTSTTTTAKATSTSSSTTKYTTTRVNFRTGPGTSYRVIRVLPTSAKLTLVSRAKDGNGRTWFKVKYGSTTGWVASWLTR
jgi:uncharacterized protein YycO